MAQRPLHLCTSCRRNTTRERVCEACKSKGAGKEARCTAAERGYDWRWQKASKAYLSENPLCRECESQGEVEPATVVDHIIPHRGNKQLFWDEENWQPLSKRCHDRKTHMETAAEGYRRYVVCGPPGAGKTTWVRKHAKANDLIWDMDEVAKAMGFTSYPRPDEVLPMLLAYREELLRRIATMARDAWVIVADSEDAGRVARRIGAKLVRMDAHRVL